MLRNNTVEMGVSRLFFEVPCVRQVRYLATVSGKYERIHYNVRNGGSQVRRQ